MLWSKQSITHRDGDAWLEEHRAHPLHHGSREFRNREWFHMVNDDIISMPDKWEYPWYAAWDLAFHTLPISIVDPIFGEAATGDDSPRAVPASQRPASRLRVELQRREPAGARLGDALPAPYRARPAGEVDLDFLRGAFNKLMLNFTWWCEPQGPIRQERFRGRVPRPRQHRRLRPERPACPPGATWSRRTAPPG